MASDAGTFDNGAFAERVCDEPAFRNTPPRGGRVSRTSSIRLFALCVALPFSLLFSSFAIAQNEAAEEEEAGPRVNDAEAPGQAGEVVERSKAAVNEQQAIEAEEAGEAAEEAEAEAEAEAQSEGAPEGEAAPLEEDRSATTEATDSTTEGMWGDQAVSEDPEPVAQQMQPKPSGPTLLEKDEVRRPGYLPGYREHLALGASRFTPRRGSLPGGLTASFGTPMPGEDWTFKFAGFMSASLQVSVDERQYPRDGQSDTVFHVRPQTVDTYGYFTSTNTVPGNWVGMRFSYGNSRVSANVSFDTWNPTRPSTYYQMGAQYFINNAYLQYTSPRIGPMNIKVRAGRFNLNYGQLGQYGSGAYVNGLVGGPQGLGELLEGDMALGEKVMLHLEHGLMLSRDGTIPFGVVAGADLGWRRPTWMASYMNHAHAGIKVRGPFEFEAMAHYVSEWSQEDRNDYIQDDAVTVQVDESDIRDGRISVYGLDLRVSHDTWGWLAGGVSYTKAKNAYPLRGLNTYGQTGEYLTDNYLGATSRGNGGILVAAVNYAFSVGKFVNYPGSFAGDGPDIQVNAGYHFVRVDSEYDEWDGKIRQKAGVDVLYTFLRYMGAAVRLDWVSPNSKDLDETFYVVAPRIVFKTNWITHEAIQLMYAKWFYGDSTRNEGTGLRTQERLDNQMLALNFNMWW